VQKFKIFLALRAIFTPYTGFYVAKGYFLPFRKTKIGLFLLQKGGETKLTTMTTKNLTPVVIWPPRFEPKKTLQWSSQRFYSASNIVLHELNNWITAYKYHTNSFK
jgi:hypothetical protein